MYDQVDMERLFESLGYDVEVLRLIADQTKVIDGTVDPAPIEMVSGKQGAVVGVTATIRVGDGSGSGQAEEILSKISALAFLSCFKILDGIVDWILECNCSAGVLSRAAWRFEDKLHDINKSELVLPPLLVQQDWLKGISFCLYRRLVPFRNEIVHRHQYRVSHGVLVVLDTRSEDRCELSIDRHRLGTLARYAVGLAGCLSAQVGLDQHMSLLMRYYADQLADIHGMDKFDQKAPLVVHVELSP